MLALNITNMNSNVLDRALLDSNTVGLLENVRLQSICETDIVV